MNNRRASALCACLLALPSFVLAQGGPGTQSRAGGRQWWENPLINNLNLSDAQRKQIQATTRDFRNRLVDARATVAKAEGELQDLFNDGTTDERKANDAIDRLVKARGELTRILTQMSWKLRGVLSAEQWQELQRRERVRVPGRFGSPAGVAPDTSRPQDPGRRRGTIPGSPAPPAAQPAKPPAP